MVIFYNHDSQRRMVGRQRIIASDALAHHVAVSNQIGDYRTLFTSIIQAHLSPVIQVTSKYPLRPRETICQSTQLPQKAKTRRSAVPIASITVSHEMVGDTLISFMNSLKPEIERMARNYYYRLPSISLALEDLVQEALIGAWKAAQRYDPSKVVNEHSFHNYCMKWARGRILNFITANNKVASLPLSQYLEVDTKDGSRERDLPDYTPSMDDSSFSVQSQVQTALHQLPELERLIITADYMGDGLSTIDVQTQFRLSHFEYSRVRQSAMQKLAQLITL